MIVFVFIIVYILCHGAERAKHLQPQTGDPHPPAAPPGIRRRQAALPFLRAEPLRRHGRGQAQAVARHAAAAAPDLGHGGLQGVPRAEAEAQTLHLEHGPLEMEKI